MFTNQNLIKSFLIQLAKNYGFVRGEGNGCNKVLWVGFSHFFFLKGFSKKPVFVLKI